MKRKYPWDLWFNGEEHMLLAGIHYNLGTPAFLRQVRCRASERRIPITTRSNAHGVLLRAIWWRNKLPQK